MAEQRDKQDLPKEIPIKTWTTKVTLQHQISLQKVIIYFLISAYGFLLVSVISIIVLLGFHAYGFSLSEGFLRWLGGATVGTVGGLLTLTFGAVFRKR